jgi:archaellum component FlaC
MEIHKQREKEKGISEQGNNNARMGRLLYETVGREKRRRRSRNTNEGEAEAPEETEITAEEVEKQIRKLKKRKAQGRDGVQMKHRCMGPKEW